MAKKLNVGDKYLSIKVVGHDFITAFKNEKTSPSQPDFKGDGIAVWVRTKQAPREEKKTDDIL